MEFYGYKKCSTCRDAHKFLLQHGVDVEFHDFVANPPSLQTLQSWVSRYGQGVLPFVNRKGTVFRDRGLKDMDLSETEWMELLHEDGKLIKRPILVTDDEIVIGFDKAAYERIANQ